MAIPNKFIKDWKRILIDTSIICGLFRSEKGDVKDTTTIFIRTLIDFLTNQKSSENKERTFLISTITISELLTRENDSAKILRILKVLNSNNVEFIDFDLETSLSFNRFLYPYLSSDKLNTRAKEFGFMTHEFMMAREWISKDLMILSSGIDKGADVVITVDKKTMYPLANELNMFCVLAYPELFTIFGTAVTNYKYEEVEEFIRKETNDTKKIVGTIVIKK